MSSENDLHTSVVDLDGSDVYDEVDLASAMQINEVHKKLQENRRALLPESHPDFDGESCMDCGNEIQKERLAMGKIRCTICQSIKEKKEKQFGKG